MIAMSAFQFGVVTLGSLVVGPVQFEVPVWLLLIPPMVGFTLLLGRKSLSGMGGISRLVSLMVRLVVIVLLAGAMAEPQWRREGKDVSTTIVFDTSDSVPAELQNGAKRWADEIISTQKKPGDRVGVVSAAKNSLVQQLPLSLNAQVEIQHVGAQDGTNLASAIRLALATIPKDAGSRLVLVSDGNETAGNLLQAAETAKALKVPIDVYPIKYRYKDEVLVDRLIAPANAREGEPINLRVVLQANTPTSGKLTITQNGDAVDLDPSPDSVATRVDLKAGLNVLQVPIPAVRSGPQKFDAIFEPDTVNGRVAGDSILQNNSSLAVSFVAGEGRVLVIRPTPVQNQPAWEVGPLLKAFEEAKLRAVMKDASAAPVTIEEMNAYDAIVLSNVSAGEFTQAQQEALRQYVHDSGGGLIMLGGPSSFGAGGWIGSPLEDALPVRLDPPQKRQMPKGALCLVMHSCEAPDGAYLGKKVAEAAVTALSRLDSAGIVEYAWQSGSGGSWVHKMAPVGDGSAIKRSINTMTYGDMPDFNSVLELAYQGLKETEAGQRHVIMISDGDPAAPSNELLDRYRAMNISISCVGVYPHSGADTGRMNWISEYTKGKYHFVNTQSGLATLPQIFIKEAQTVRRSLIWEGPPSFKPSVVGVPSEGLRGLSQSVPAIRGYVVTAEREGLALTTLTGKEGDPILAQWQYGLGKVVAYTSDAVNRWSVDWVGWDGYRQFWEQHLRWVMRPGGSANVRVVTENRGDQTMITVEALDTKGDRLNFANFKGRLALPGGGGLDVNLKQVGPGRYVGVVPTDKSGSYVMSLRYAAPDPAATGTEEGKVLEGSVQAAITRPFADEFRSLEDNAPLLLQVASMTGGKVLTGDSKVDQLWLRDGVQVPVSLRPMWLAAAIAGLGLFLVDVGVRRVRVDWKMIKSVAFGALSGAKAKGVGRTDTLRAAREQAKAKIAARSDGLSPAELQRETERAVRDAEKQATQTSKAKFEASADDLKRGKDAAPIVMGGADARPTPTKPRASISDASKVNEGGGLSRLKQAKQKARDGMDDEGTA